jgi:penicillin-binding protein 1A
VLDEALLLMDLMGSGEKTPVLEGLITRYARASKSADVEGAFIALDPATGAIRAMVGGGRFTSDNQLNRAVQARRQPGSSFKAFVYGAGIESGKVTPATAFIDLPLVFQERYKDRIWSPSNYGGNFQGRVLARRAFSASLNIASVNVYEAVGGRTVASFASRLTGIPFSRFAVDPTLALGSTEVSPMEMARGFSVFANGGSDVEPHAVTAIHDSSRNTIFRREQKSEAKRLISREVAFIMTSMLRDVVDRGTATEAIRGNVGFSLPAAGKTGTNTKFRDAWFVGYTPDLVAAVWFGCNSQFFTLGGGQSGSVVAAPVWARFMKGVYENRKTGAFPERPGGVKSVDICGKTGLLPEKDCPRRRELFLAGTEPLERCDGDHTEMTSIFDMAEKRGRDAGGKERRKLERERMRNDGIETE